MISKNPVIATICIVVLILPTYDTATLVRLPSFGHPFAQRGNDDLAADNHHRRQAEPPRGFCSTSSTSANHHHQFIGDGIEKGAERRGLIEPARQIAIEPIGEAGAAQIRWPMPGSSNASGA